uniref:Reverse transcriptase Ty1/copia-type domain-containing protein n=1 Tax=Physcomitrium patens TaxID=3218 RepID=A0A7I4ER32_PHYPA
LDLIEGREGDIEFMASISYIHVIKNLQYLVTYIRYKLAFAIHHMAQFMAKPSPIHWIALKYILCY